jgi:hypothetical protein
MIPPDTYFVIKLWVNKKTKIFGPYSDLKYAMVMLVDHIPAMAKMISNTNIFNYKAEIHECLVGNDLSWETISIPITENKCTRRKFKDKK